jgi:hypothetical protein
MKIELILKSDIIEDLFQQIENEIIMNTFLNNLDKPIEKKTVEYKTHPTATMIKESFMNINYGFTTGFNKLYFLKCYKKAWHDVFQVSNRTEEYWDWNLFLRQFKRL